MRRTKDPVLVGIDVGSRLLQMAVCAHGKTFEEAYPNDAAGHRAILGRLSRYKAPVRVCVEATGTYSLDICCALTAQKHQVMLLNPRASMHYAKAKMRRAKTDRVDALVLAEMAGFKDFVPWTPPSATIHEFRMTMRRALALIESAADERNRLAAAQATEQTPAFVLDDIESNIQSIDLRVANVRNHALALIPHDDKLTKTYNALISMPGIGEASALALAAELVALPDDMTAAQVVAYAGLDPRPKETGGPEMGRRSISRLGNGRLRKALFFPAMTAMRMNSPFKAIAESLVARGKDKLVALVAIMRRMLVIAWTLVSSDQIFDPARVGKRISQA